jgi:hypothetical protein
MSKRLLIALVTLVLAGACSPMRWEHPSLSAKDDPQLGLDQEYCRAWAERQAFAASGAYGGYGTPRYRRVRGRDGRYYFEPDLISGPEFGSPAAQRWRYEDECMRAKGYQLVPR